MSETGPGPLAVSVCLVREDDLQRVRDEPERAQALADQGDTAECVELGEDWKALHFAFTGEAWAPGARVQGPLARAVLGDDGEPVPAVDCGLGPGRLLSPADVREVWTALSRLPTNLVAQRLLVTSGAEGAALHQAELVIGPELELYDDLKDLYADAVDEGAGLLFTFC